MALVEDRDVPGRARLPVAAAIVLTALATPLAGASARPQTMDASGTSSRPQPTCTQGNCLFLLEKGRYTTIELPGRVPYIVEVNNLGQIAGIYFDDAGGEHGFVRDRRGKVTDIDFPEAMGSYVTGINDHGQTVGSYSDTNPSPGRADDTRGFLRDRRGRFSAIHVPGAAITQPFGINNRSQVVGEYYEPDGTVHGFRSDKGRFTTIDAPDATGTSITDINDRGQMIGVYLDASGTPHAFFQDKDAGITTIDAPDAPYTLPSDINNRGQIVGYTAVDLALTEIHGFLLARGAKCPFTQIDFPGALTTAATGINDRAQIVGIYANPDATPDGQQSPMRMPMMMSGGDG
jgi:hypothetical protein